MFTSGTRFIKDSDVVDTSFKPIKGLKLYGDIINEENYILVENRIFKTDRITYDDTVVQPGSIIKKGSEIKADINTNSGSIIAFQSPITYAEATKIVEHFLRVHNLDKDLKDRLFNEIDFKEP